MIGSEEEFHEKLDAAFNNAMLSIIYLTDSYPPAFRVVDDLMEKLSYITLMDMLKWFGSTGLRGRVLEYFYKETCSGSVENLVAQEMTENIVSELNQLFPGAGVKMPESREIDQEEVYDAVNASLGIKH